MVYKFGNSAASTEKIEKLHDVLLNEMEEKSDDVYVYERPDDVIEVKIGEGVGDERYEPHADDVKV